MRLPQRYLSYAPAGVSFLIGTAAAQSTPTSSASVTTYTGSIGVCNESISNANASGIFPFAVDYPLNDPVRESGEAIQNVPDPAWAVTVTGGDNGEQVHRTVWYSTAGQNYSDDLALNYDVCAYVISGLPINTVRLGQDDNGDCRSTLSSGCIDALTQRAASSAIQWVTYSSPPPYSNLTAGVLPYICSAILNDLGDENRYPEECRQDFGLVKEDDTAGVSTLITSLTGFNDSTLNDECTVTSAPNKTFNAVSSMASSRGYDNATQEVTVALAVWMSVANIKRTSFYSAANSTLRCLRTTDFSEGSRRPVALPAGKPYKSTTGLSAGAKGGIAAGVIIAALLVLLAAFCIRRRRKQRKLKLAKEEEDAAHGEDEKALPLPPEADGEHGLHQLHSVDRKPELASAEVAELGGGGGKAAELSGGGGKAAELNGEALVELPVDTPHGTKHSA